MARLPEKAENAREQAKDFLHGQEIRELVRALNLVKTICEMPQNRTAKSQVQQRIFLNNIRALVTPTLNKYKDRI